MHTADDNLLKEQSRCIAHEIRNHISICDVYSEIIKKHLEKENIDNPSIQNALMCIQKSVKLINNSLLDLKSVNNTVLKEVDLRSLLLEGVKMSKIYANDKNITFIDGINITAKVNIDENKFLACIVNIIKNAVEAISENGIIEISLTKDKYNAYVRISNNGAPISAETQKSIFTEGYTTKPTGSGLGLYICQNNLKMQNASLKLIRSDKERTVFEITVPVVNK